MTTIERWNTAPNKASEKSNYTNCTPALWKAHFFDFSEYKINPAFTSTSHCKKKTMVYKKRVDILGAISLKEPVLLGTKF